MPRAYLTRAGHLAGQSPGEAEVADAAANDQRCEDRKDALQQGAGSWLSTPLLCHTKQDRPTSPHKSAGLQTVSSESPKKTKH